MMEKAYAKYTEEYGASYADPRPGMGSIWRNESMNFMNAIFEEKSDATMLPLTEETRLYQKNKEGEFINHPDYYLDEENKVFSALDKYVNQKKEIMTAIPDKQAIYTKGDPHAEGIRNGHVYTIRKVFEQDGKKIVQLRDPYACFSPKYNGKNLEGSTSDVIKGTLNGGMETMGTFNMEMKDFMRHFTQFSGMSKEASKEFRELNGNARSYFMAPVTKAEMASETPINVHAEETEKEFGKMNEQRLKRRERIAAQVLGNKDAMKALSEKIDKLTKEVKSTDEMFIWSNSMEFNSMRNDLYAFNKMLKNHISGKEPMTAQQLNTQLSLLKNESDEYTRTKEVSMNKVMASGKKVSDRAMHRYAAAINLNCIVNFEDPVCNWPSKKAESLNILKGDIEARLDGIEERQLNGKMTAQDRYAQRMLDKVNDLIDKNENVKEGGKLTKREVKGKGL